MKIKNFIMLIFFFSYPYLLGSQPCGRTIFEEKNALNHPFKKNDPEGKHDIQTLMMHINTDSNDKDFNENIWFLICKIERTNKTPDGITTDHTTKKLIYDLKTRSLRLIGKKKKYFDLDFITESEVSQRITPREIITTKDSNYTHGLDTNEIAKTNKTEFFCTTLQEKYGSPIAITLKRFKADRSAQNYDDYTKDNFPRLGDNMTVYFDSSSFPTSENAILPDQSQESTSPESSAPFTSNKTPATPVKKSFFSANRILALSFASLITYLLLNHFFEIHISIKPR